MPTRRNLLAAAPLLAAPQLLRAATTRPPLLGKIAIDGNRLITSVWINQEQFLFVIDSGTSQNKIRPEIAARLHLQALGNSDVRGLGRKATMVGLYAARNVVIGGMARQPLMTFQTYDFANGLRRDAAGLLAVGALTAYPTAMDFAKGEWVLYRDGLPELPGYRLWPARVSRMPGDTSERIYVDATFDGTPLRLLLDTGAPRNLLLFPKTTAKLKLFEGTRTFTPVDTRGFGGQSRYPSRGMQVGALQIGAYRFDNISYVAMDPREEGKHFGADGIIGLNLISLFDIAIEPRRNRLLVRRNTLPFMDRAASPGR